MGKTAIYALFLPGGQSSPQELEVIPGSYEIAANWPGQWLVAFPRWPKLLATQTVIRREYY